jgi:dienelactone hydrolase
VTVAERGRVVTSLYYEGEPYRGKPTRVFAYLARPEKAEGRLPAMVLVHGGTAFPGWAELWARRGYVALAMGLAGQGPGRVRRPDGGPA